MSESPRPKAASPGAKLTRRERQIMDVLYRDGEATVADVMAQMPDPPSYSAVRATMNVLEEKGHVRHEEESLHYVYLPTVGRDTARRSALRHMVSTFFDGSVEQAVAALLDLSAAKLSEADLDRISGLIQDAREDARKEGA